VNSEVKKVLFIVNKYSGSRYQADIEGTITDACAIENIEGFLSFTKGKGHATEMAKEASISNEFEYVVAVGGDGTINEVANGLLNSNVPLGIIPKGSGNGLARHLGISMNLRQSLNMLFNSQVIRMDTFRINGKLSLNVSGIGFDGHVANIFGTRKHRGLYGYTTVSLNEFMKFKEFEAELITTNGSAKRKAFVIAIANSSQYGNNARIAPAASVCDGLLHICLLKKIPAYRLDFIYSFFAGTIATSTFCEVIESSEMTIKVNSPTAFHVDGEPGGVADTFSIEILPKSLNILVPQSSLKY
jgi:diacylglycerol kinase (ATP)